MMYIFSFSFFFLGPCIPAGHLVFTWIVQTLIIVHMALVVYGQCLWLCIYGYVYGCRFMGLYGRISGCMDVFLTMCLWLWLCVCGYVYGYWVSILREAWFINIGAYLSLGPVSIIIGSYSFTRPVSTTFGTYSFTRSISTIFGSYSFTRPISANFGTYSSMRPISTILGTYSFTRPILAIFGTYSSTRPIWMTLRIFPIFLRQKWKNFAPVCSVE
jgi:hypothetical protein